jgi:SulP family sulfate permease
VRRLYGALFFGAVAKLEAVAATLPEGTRALVLEAHRLIAIDTSGIDALRQLHRSLEQRGVRLHLADLNEQPRGLIHRSELDALIGPERLHPDLADALAAAAQA